MSLLSKMNWGLRWLAVLPAAALAAFLSAFPLHLVLYRTLTSSGFIEPYPETPERVLLPLVAAMAFVWAGAHAAPSHKMETAVVLFGLWLILAGATIALEWSGANVRGYRLHSYGGGLSSAMAVVGAFAGLFVVRQGRTLRATASDSPKQEKVLAGPSEQSERDFEAETEKQHMQTEVEKLRRELQLLDDPQTIFSFGQMAYDGDGMEQDYAAAANWFRMAAERGHAKAQHNLALMYESGRGVPQDLTAAVRWYRLAAEQGNAGSQNNLGCLYEHGQGVAQDHAAAIEWYRRGKEGGDSNAGSNFERLQAEVRLNKYREIVAAFGDMVEKHVPLIGDCRALPHPKRTIMYAILWVRGHYETVREQGTDEAFRQSCDRIIGGHNFLLTLLVNHWHEIDADDRDAVAKLSAFQSFPDWALPLKARYINDERAAREACDAAIEVMRDRVQQEQSTD